MKKIICLSSIIFLMLQSCSSESDSSNPLIQGKLKKITSSNYSINYNYDANGSLISYDEALGSNITTKHTFIRDSNGKITSYTYNNIQNSPITITTNYTRDSNNKVVSSVTKYSGASNPDETRTYVYIGNLTTQINISDGSKDRYTFDSNGNLIKMENLAVNSNQWKTFTTMTYDNMKNPIEYEDINPMGNIFMCNNNIISNTNANGIQSKTSYTYNNQNVPISSLFQGIQVNYYYN
ncbi:hypothetical protein [Flavobacterium lacustre]|uniref:hypothetical protein n=1 Tax=Flavobacterium lacustre TaxID=3016339 RepID=UPI0022B6A9C1|nr:hypothetical protein [Flavobacterium lacustre]